MSNPRRKLTHFEAYIDENCERKWCVDRRNADCQGECEVEPERKTDRYIHCHTKFYCSSYGWCDLHGEHGP